MASEVEFGERAPQPAMAVRVRSAVENLSAAFDAGYTEIAAYLGETGVTPIGAPFAIYHNMDMTDMDVEMGMPVVATVPGRGRVYPMELPGGTWATTMHVGPYDQVSGAYEVLMAAVAGEGFAPGEISCEFYLNEPGTVSPDQLQTLVGFPLKTSRK